MYIWEKSRAVGRVGSGQTFCRQSRVGSGQVNVSPGRVGSGPRKVTRGQLCDIDENIKSDMLLFADDVALSNRFKNLKTLENEINSDLKHLNDWACKWNNNNNNNNELL